MYTYILCPSVNLFFYSDVIVYCNESLQTISSMEMEFREKKAIMESKNKLLNILKKTDLNQRYF